MSRNPTNGPPGGPRRRLTTPRHARIPKLRTYCWQIRDEMGLSRRQADELIGVSARYIGQIETGDRIPSFELVEKIIDGYGLDPDQARHMRDLRAPAIDLLATDQLRAQVHQSPHLLAHLAEVERQGVLAVVIDPMWNVLAANPSFLHAFPGLGPTDNTLTYFFREPAAKAQFIEWPLEAPYSVAMAKGATGRYRNSPQARQLLGQTAPNREFSDFWTTSTRITYGRNPDDHLHCRDPDTGEPYSISLQISEVSEPRDVLLAYGFRKPYTGPPLN